MSPPVTPALSLLRVNGEGREDDLPFSGNGDAASVWMPLSSAEECFMSSPWCLWHSSASDMAKVESLDSPPDLFREMDS
jgi:hypothetical protein